MAIWDNAWETINDDKPKCETTERLAVPGGWIYRTQTRLGVAMCFVKVAFENLPLTGQWTTEKPAMGGWKKDAVEKASEKEPKQK